MNGKLLGVWLLCLCQVRGWEASSRGSLKIGRTSRSLALAITDTVHTLETVETMQIVEQEITSQFLLLALGEADRGTLDSKLAWMDQYLLALAQGDEALHIIPPPGEQPNQTLVALTRDFADFKALVLNNVGSLGETVSPASVDILSELHMRSKALTLQLHEMKALYDAYAVLQGESEPPEIRTSNRLGFALENVARTSLMAMLQVHKEENCKEMEEFLAEFAGLHQSLIWGSHVLGLERASDLCVVQRMYEISGTWLAFRAVTARMQISETPFHSSLIADFRAAKAGIHSSLGKASDVLHGDSSSCSFSFTESKWLHGAEEKNRLRVLVQAAIRRFLQLKMEGGDSVQRLEVVQDMTEASKAAKNVFEGNYLSFMPPPPTQELLDDAALIWDKWHAIEEEIVLALNSDQELANEDLANDIYAKSDELEDILGNFSLHYVKAALAVHASNRIVVGDLSYRQLALIEKLTKQALKIALRESAVNHTGRFEQTITQFEEGHSELLLGSTPSTILLGVFVPRTESVCLLNFMFQVETDFKELMSTLRQLFGAKDYLQSHIRFVAAEAANPVLVQAFEAFEAGWESYRIDDATRMQDLRIAYIFSNPNAVGSKDNFDYAEGPEDYHQAHKQYHPVYRDILYARNYYDIFFFDLRGNLIYSVYKELDYATNFAANGTGEWKDSGLGEAFEAAMRNPNQINVIDWKPYGPSYGALASFLSTGIKKNGALIGVFCTQMPPESKPITVAEMEPKLNAAEAAQHLAINAYIEGGGACGYELTIQQYELALEKISRLEYKFQKTETEFALLASGFTAQWLTASAAGLEEHKQYLVVEAAKPELVEAMWEFKQAWDAFRETDAERLLSLQIAYILLNPHPTGSKDALDHAPGPEEYHAVHARFHPQYRAILYERNYYDIFFLDTAGNCIYSVYKELDYATNFLADGPGEWRNSGLGEAFRAAMSNPDGINVIDWKPYGPSNGALASFLSTGIRRLGELIGVFCTQLPPEFTPRDSAIALNQTLDEMHDVLWDFRYGNNARAILPPASQSTTNALFNASDIWVGFDDELHATPTVEALNRSSSIGARILMSSDQMLCKVQVGRREDGISHCGTRADSFEAERLLEALDENWANLSLGLDLPVDVRKMLQTMDASVAAWIQDIHQGASEIYGELLRHDHEDGKNRTTTMLTLEILAPVPLTGSWIGGQTFRLVARLAEDIINQDQLILPGYQIKHHFIDDHCDPGTEKGNSYVAVAGLGCDEVCRQVTSLAVSMRLPFLSYECAHADFSDTSLYPALTRMGTPTNRMVDVVTDLRENHGWSKIYVVTGDSAMYQTEAEAYVSSFQASGLQSEWLNAREFRWDEITGVMNTIKGQSPGLERVIFFIGSETLYRKLICASITQGLQKGIVWLSQGTWRRNWWKRSDILTSTHRQWLTEDVYSRNLQQALPAFKTAWDSYSADAETTRQSLINLYVTDEKDALEVAEGPERYHAVHQEWHPIYRAKLIERNYYDIFMFDLDGNLIYSVFKETDYGTNFRANGNGTWKDSALGQAYQQARANPDSITYIDFTPYGPSNGADAAFLATGLRNEDTGELIGIYSIQLPPEYEKSIEAVEPQCSFEAIESSFMGSMNLRGMGQASQENMEKPLDCLKGYSPQSFLTLLDKHLDAGYPEGDRSTVVNDPYVSIKAHAVDGVCALAFGIQYLLRQGYTVADIQTPTPQ
ncbi:Gabbr1, partial [Symbiodinium sp. CCMP2592]